MFSHDLKKWQIFNTLEPEFMLMIRTAIVYGDSGDKALVITQKDDVYALGNDRYNLQIGESAFSPVKVEELCQKKIKTFACGKNYVLALTEQGQVYSWEAVGQHVYQWLDEEDIYRSNRYNRKSNSSSKNMVTHDLKMCRFIVDIACGINHSLTLTDKGTVYELKYVKDQGSVTTYKEYTLPNNPIICIACGKDFSMIVSSTGEVYGCGENSIGQIGIGKYSEVTTFVKVAALNDVVIEKIVCGYTHTLALSTTGVLYAWGGNSSGQLGLDIVNNSVPNPTKLEAGKMGRVWDVAALNCSHISVAMGEGNLVFIWGQCMGQNIIVPRRTPLRCLHDAFAYCAWPSMTYQPLVFHNGTSSNVTNSLDKAFDDENTSDFVIKVKGRPIYVHKAILMIRSQYFRTMFEGKWAESSDRDKSIDNFSYQAYRLFLKYLYTDKIDVCSIFNAMELLKIADMYCVNPLKRLCIPMLIENITLENVVFFYKLSNTCNAEELERCCFQFVLNHMSAVVQISDFMELDKDILKKFLIKAAKAGAFKT